MSKKFSWKDGARFKVDADTVGQELERLYNKHDLVTAEILLDAARDEDSPLHNLYEWDDSIAAEKWRKHQSRTILYSLRVTEVDGDKPRIMNVAIRLEDGRRGYQKTSIAVQDKTLWEQVMDDTRKDLMGVQERLENLIAVETADKRRTATAIRDSVDKTLRLTNGA